MQKMTSAYYMDSSRIQFPQLMSDDYYESTYRCCCHGNDDSETRETLDYLQENYEKLEKELRRLKKILIQGNQLTASFEAYEARRIERRAEKEKAAKEAREKKRDHEQWLAEAHSMTREQLRESMTIPRYIKPSKMSKAQLVELYVDYKQKGYIT